MYGEAASSYCMYVLCILFYGCYRHITIMVIISSHDRDHAGEDARAKDLEPWAGRAVGERRRSEDFQPGGDGRGGQYYIPYLQGARCMLYTLSSVAHQHSYLLL
jgi:hypothetical protein